jgi:hypothetical protein
MIPLPIATARSFEGISFRPDRWAARENEALAERVDRIRARSATLNAMPGADQIGAELLDGLIQSHGAKTAAYWSAMSRCMSPMIAGPARFPVERNRKRTETADKRLAEVITDLDRVTRVLERCAFPHGMPGGAIRGDDPDAVTKLKARLAEGPRHAERKRLELRIASLEVRQERGRIERETEFFKVVEDPDLDRIQIIFHDRPDDETRAVLKGRGFRWAPSHGAWQRHLNHNGRWAAKYVESDLARAAATTTHQTEGERDPT